MQTKGNIIFYWFFWILNAGTRILFNKLRPSIKRKTRGVADENRMTKLFKVKWKHL